MFRHTARNPAGYTISQDVEGKVVEHDTLQCCHCGAHWEVIRGSGIARGFCQLCMGPTCGKQECEARCRPLEQQLREAESRG